MNFKPKTERDISEMNLLPQGYYAFEVIHAEETKSKKGADMKHLHG